MKLPDLSKISKRDKMILYAGAVVLFLVGGYYLAVTPWLEYRSKIKKQIKSLELVAQENNFLLSREMDILRERALYEKHVHFGVSSEVEIALFLKEIESLAGQVQVSLQEIRPLGTEFGEWHREYGLEVRFVAQLPNWIRFVHALENAATLFTISKVQMEKDAEDPRVLKGVMQVRKLVVSKEPLATEAGA